MKEFIEVKWTLDRAQREAERAAMYQLACSRKAEAAVCVYVHIYINMQVPHICMEGLPKDRIYL